MKTATGTWSISCNGENRPVRFENAGTQTVVECGYDSLGRRFEKKVTVAGTQEPALKRVIYWDPTEETATRPLATSIVGDNVYFPTVDLTKNVCEVFGSDGYIKTTYSYSPFGNVSSVGNFEQNFQWSSEFYDSDLNLVYYNYRHYSPTTARWLSRDPIEEIGGLNLYCFVSNNPIIYADKQGLSFSNFMVCLGKCIKDNDVMDKLEAFVLGKIMLLFAGGGVPKSFAVRIAQMTGNDKYVRALSLIDPKDPASSLAWKPIKAALLNVPNGKIYAKNITRTSLPILIAHGNIMAAVELECSCYCCKNSHYDSSKGLSVFNINRVIEFCFRNLEISWKALGYDESELLY